MGTPSGFNVATLLTNRNFLNLLAGVGADLDPEGAGGALGRATIALNKGLAAQEAKEQADARIDAYNQQALAFLAREGGFTPQGQRGVPLFKANPDGSFRVDLNLADANSPLVPVTLPPQATSETQTSTPAQTAAPTTTAPALVPETTAPTTPQQAPVQISPVQPTTAPPQTSSRQSRTDLVRSLLPFYFAPQAYRQEV
jgi:hypothetical protein